MSQDLPFIPFAIPQIDESEIDAVVSTMKSGWLTTGPKTAEFEKRFAEFIGCKHALAVNSATAGLHLSLEAIGIGPGDEVATTPFTFTATAEAIHYLGAHPKFIDIDPENYNISIPLLEKELAANPNIKAILPVHFAGLPCDMDRIMELGKAYSIPVIEDAAHALPATINGKKIGTFGDATVYSFYATKTLCTGEGGMVCTENDEFAARVSTMRLHGIDRNVFNRYTSTKPSWQYDVVAAGYKYNLTDIASAIGIEQLRKQESLREGRETLANLYNREFSELPVSLPPTREDCQHAWHLYPLVLNTTSLSRNEFIEELSKAGIGTSVHFIPLHIQPFWKNTYQLEEKQFPESAKLFNSIVSLPLYPSLTDDETSRIMHSVKTLLT